MEITQDGAEITVFVGPETTPERLAQQLRDCPQLAGPVFVSVRAQWPWQAAMVTRAAHVSRAVAVWCDDPAAYVVVDTHVAEYRVGDLLGRPVRLSRAEVEDHLARGGRWLLAIDPETWEASIVAQQPDGLVPDVAGHEDLFPLTMAVERKDGFIEGGDWVTASTPNRRAHDGQYRNYRIIWR